MNVEQQLPQFVFNYDINLLKRIVSRLKLCRYGQIQYIPTVRSLLGIPKEPQNLLNFLFSRKHLLFHYSLFPRFYSVLSTLKKRALRTCFSACYLNAWIVRDELEAYFGKELVEEALDNRILIARNNKLQFSLSFVPFRDYIVTRDPHYTYPPYINGRRKFNDRVWMGWDTINFAGLLCRLLKGRHFDAAIEMGSGTGLPIITAATLARKCVAVDINRRAVSFTRINAALNGITHLDGYHSNLFTNVNEDFDLVLANPWYCDLATGGLEQIPAIVDGLHNHLRDNGLCIMVATSYVKKGKDHLYCYLTDVARQAKYDIEMYTLGFGVELNRSSSYRIYGVEHGIYYGIVLKKAGSGKIRRHNAPLSRRMRDFAYIYCCRRLFKF